MVAVRYVVFSFSVLLAACGGSSGQNHVASSSLVSASSGAVPVATSSSSDTPSTSSSSRTSSSSSSSSSSSDHSPIYSACVGASSSASSCPNSKIEVRVPYAYDYVYLTINGIKHRVGYWAQPSDQQGWLDISHWFSNGENSLLVQAMNDGGTGWTDVEVRLDNQSVFKVICPSGECSGGQSGIYYEAKRTFANLKLPEAGSVTVEGLEVGEIYIDDTYVGASPRTISLPPGKYKIGYGVSNDNLADMNDAFYADILALGKLSAFTLKGKFYETEVEVVAGQKSSVVMDVVATPLPPQNTVKIAILPFKTVRSDDIRFPLELTQAMVDGFASQIKATADTLAFATFYGLSKWEVTVLPMDESLGAWSIFRSELAGILYNTRNLPQYKEIYDTYDVVVLFQSAYDKEGNIEPAFAGGMSASGSAIHVTSGWTWTLPANALNRGFYHEMLHHYEFWERDIFHHYRGLGGLHGQRVHGFTGVDQSVQHYYRLYARGQAGEDKGMRDGVDWPTPAVAGQPNAVGVFHAIRYGRVR